MKLNEAVIKHYDAEMIPTHKLKKVVSLNEDYLKEKPTWYEINGTLKYFKIRNDFRLFTEQFFSIFGKEIMGFDTLDYEVAYLRTQMPGESISKSKPQTGLLSTNFQSEEYNYYLASELMNPDISKCSFFGKYSLKTLLTFFEQYLDKKDFKKNELFLIKLFIADAFTHQEDRNPNNIGFQIPKIDGVKYNKRLFGERLLSLPTASKYLTIEDNVPLLKGFEPSPVYDNERIFGTDHKNVFTYTKGQIWCPLFPYSEELLFNSQEIAKDASETLDGADPNLFSLYCDYEDICKPIFERLAYDDEYRKILEQFKGGTSQINLSEEDEERVTRIIEDKREQFTRILHM